MLLLNHINIKGIVTMNTRPKRNSLLCPNCRTLVSRSAERCPRCGLNKPGSPLKDNIISRSFRSDQNILRLILGANVVMFLISLAIDLRPQAFSGSPFSLLSPSNEALLILGSTGTIPLFHLGRWWTLISANYLHGSLLHIVFNMIALYQLGPLLIREYGVGRMVTIYTLSGVGGYLISSLFMVQFTIGASAAVCGLIGAALYYGKSRGGTYGNAVYSQIGGWALGIFLFGFLVPGINNWGHGGGMLTGMLLGYLLGYRERRKETILHTYLGTICIIGSGFVLLWALSTTFLRFLLL